MKPLSGAMLEALNKIKQLDRERHDHFPESDDWVHVNLFYKPEWYTFPTSEGINLRTLNALQTRGLIEIDTKEGFREEMNPREGVMAKVEVHDTYARLTDSGRVAIAA